MVKAFFTSAFVREEIKIEKELLQSKSRKTSRPRETFV